MDTRDCEIRITSPQWGVMLVAQLLHNSLLLMHAHGNTWRHWLISFYKLQCIILMKMCNIYIYICISYSNTIIRETGTNIRRII